VRKIGEKLLKWYLAIRYNEKGATAVEYAIMVALIAVVIIVAVTTLGQRIAATFDEVGNELSDI
jgi:pilus assembly protein Flp/PilA